MTVEHLIEVLSAYPPDTPIFHEDFHWGGRDNEFHATDVKLEDGAILIGCPFHGDGPD